MTINVSIQTARSYHICQSVKCRFSRNINPKDRYLRIEYMSYKRYPPIPDVVMKRHAHCPQTPLEVKHNPKRAPAWWMSLKASLESQLSGKRKDR